MAHDYDHHPHAFGLAPAILLALAVIALATPAVARTPELVAAMGHKWGKIRATEGLRRLFPAGTSEQALLDAVSRDGFHLGKPRKDGSRFARGYQGGGNIACTDIYTVTWRTDDAGRITAIDGDVEGSC
jgi:hypothetical protein